MKKIILIGLLTILSYFGFSQSPTYIGTPVNTTIVRNDIQINGLIPGYGVGKVMTINSAGKVVLVTPGTGDLVFLNIPKYYVNGYGDIVQLNTDSIVIGAVNKFYTDARVQNFADTRYSLLTHNHTLNSLSNVTITSPTNGQSLVWSSSLSKWINADVSSGTNPSITLTGDIQGTGTTTIPSIIAAGVIINNKLASVNQYTFKGRISAGVGAPEDLTINETKGILQINNIDNTSDISKPISSAAQVLFDLKANLSSPAFTGVPTVPTAPLGTNNNQAASTAFVLANSGGGSGYTLPIATNSALGGIKIGTNINIAPDGTISTSFPVTSFNGRTGAITPTSGDYTFSQIGSKPTTLNGYGITDGLTQALGDARYSLLGHIHAASDITSGVFSPARLGSGTANSSTWLKGTSGWSSISEADVTNLVNDLALKANASNPSLTGQVDLPRTTNAALQQDTIPLLTFGGGGGLAGDTAIFTTNTIYGSIRHTGSDTLVITSISYILQGSSPVITVDVFSGTNFNSGGTAVVTGTLANSTTGGVSVVSSVKIPPGRFIWCKTPTVTAGSKPTFMGVTLVGYKIRK